MKAQRSHSTQAVKCFSQTAKFQDHRADLLYKTLMFDQTCLSQRSRREGQNDGERIDEEDKARGRQRSREERERRGRDTAVLEACRWVGSPGVGRRLRSVETHNRD